MAPCDHCGSETPDMLDGTDFDGSEALCPECADACMEHGHAHVHDEPEDCIAFLPYLNRSGRALVACSAPRR